MTDIRNYKDTIRNTVKTVNAEDTMYNWSVKSINKNEATFTWSYLGENDGCFRVLVKSEDEVDTLILCEVPHCGNVMLLVCDDFYADAKTVEEGIEMAIKAAAKRAHNCF